MNRFENGMTFCLAAKNLKAYSYYRSKEYFCMFYFKLSDFNITSIETYNKTYILNFKSNKIFFYKMNKKLQKRVFDIMEYEYKTKNKRW